MKTILFVSELGEGLGHVAPLVIIANAILNEASAKKRPRIIFAVKNAVNARRAFGDAQFPFLAAPTNELPQTHASHTSSYIEILARIGFTNANLLTPALQSWDDLYDLVKPSLIIAEHSPTACLAARGCTPVLLVGSGYTMPPVHTNVFPALRTGMQPPAVHALMLEQVNNVMDKRNQQKLDRLPQLLDTKMRAVFTLPDLDPYAGLRNEPVLGTYNENISHSSMPKEKRIFLYLGAVPEQLDKIIQSVGQTGVNISAYLGERESAAKHYLKALGATIYETPPNLSDILRQSCLIISHGGAGLSTAAITTGRPQLVFPIHAESMITAGRIEHHGIGLCVEKGNEVNIPDALDGLLNVRRFAENAQSIAGKIANSTSAKNPVTDIAKAALSII